jgi:hypothetical protein
VRGTVIETSDREKDTEKIYRFREILRERVRENERKIYVDKE